MLEVEIKAYCHSHEEVINSIVALGGQFLEQRHEQDIYFNHPSRDFEKTDEACRIRVVNDENILTYKGPKISKNTKTRYEEEVKFENFNSMMNILLKLGFKLVEEVIKKRAVYIFDKIEICIDRVEDVGDFVEFELRDSDKEMSEKKLFSLAEKLGLSKFETRSYLELKLANK